MNNLTNESTNDMQEVLTEMKELLTEVTNKEHILQENTEKYLYDNLNK